MPEIRTAAQGHVLAIVDRLAGCLIDERTGSPSPPRARFAKRRAHPAFPQRGRRRQSRQSTSDNDDMLGHERAMLRVAKAASNSELGMHRNESNIDGDVRRAPVFSPP